MASRSARWRRPRCPTGVVSPGGVGFDINCGVRLLALPVTAAELGPRKETLTHELSRRIPTGTGRGGGLTLDAATFDRVLVAGPHALLDAMGLGTADDLARTEAEGQIAGAVPGSVSERARQRGAAQVGTMGSGNHFVELGRVTEVFDAEAARVLGLGEGQVTALIHSGSRGLGHQVCTDYVKRMDVALASHGIALPDRQLSCAPASSPDGRAYLAAMAAAANFAWANRHVMAHGVRDAVRSVLGDAAARGTRQVYDVAHNVFKRERHRGLDVLVHRKGAMRAFAPAHPDLPAAYRQVGQRGFIPGSMGTSSEVLVGQAGAAQRSFATVCHGAGRQLSRTQARKRVTGAELRRRLEGAGITVRCPFKTRAGVLPPGEKVVDVVEGTE